MSDVELRVQAIRHEAEGILRVELRSPDGSDLPSFEAGGHVDIELGSGRWRSYSLCNSPAERFRYVLAIQLDPDGRGGSRHVHETLRVGQRIRMRGPRNQFALDEGGEANLLIAGGIGVTPILAMAERLSVLGRPWTLHYFARSPETTALLPRLRALCMDSTDRQVHVHWSATPGRPTVDAVVRSAEAHAHLYCCGPQRMLQAFETACQGRPPDHVHLERFAAADAAAVEGGFVLELAKTGKTLAVPSGRSVLDVLLGAGIAVPHSCLSGICGSCEVTVLDGMPDHRDGVLSAAERAAGRSMMVCCSGSKSERLVLDL